MQTLHTLAENLLVYEVLTGDEIDTLIKGQPLYKEVKDETPTVVPSKAVDDAVSEDKVKVKMGLGMVPLKKSEL
jgi:hypothetical protein